MSVAVVCGVVMLPDLSGAGNTSCACDDVAPTGDGRKHNWRCRRNDDERRRRHSGRHCCWLVHVDGDGQRVRRDVQQLRDGRWQLVNGQLRVQQRIARVCQSKGWL